MRPRTTIPRAALALGVLTSLALAPGALGAPGPPPALLATSGEHGELLQAVPIAKRPQVHERVAMSLGPDRLQVIQAGDRLRASAEVQVSTTCLDPGPRCIGRNYDINPRITARIVLAGAQSATAASIPLSPTTTKLCKQRRPNRNHHCTLTIPNVETPVVDPATLPCVPGACFVNLIVGAYNKHARRGDRVVLGADRPDGSVVQDKGRLNLVQAHADVPAPTVSSSATLVNGTLPLTEGKKEKRRVVYSVPMPALKKGEIVAFDASYLTGISDLGFNTFVSSRVIAATSPFAADSTGIAKSVLGPKGAASEGNGFNCTLGPSGYANPCTTVKAGAALVNRDALDKATGQPVTLYLNVFASAKPLLTTNVKTSQQVSIAPLPGGLTVSRYAP